jgi:hypothetical protein
MPLTLLGRRTSRAFTRRVAELSETTRLRDRGEADPDEVQVREESDATAPVGCKAEFYGRRET